MKRTLLASCILLMIFPAAGRAGIILSGLVRNDTSVVVEGGDAHLMDRLETRLVFTARKDDRWKFYADGRAFLLYGTPWMEAGFNPAYQGYAYAKLMRSFLRIYFPVGDVTLGKTYINFGNAGIFNPFDLDRSVNFSDLDYDREGILAAEVNLFSGNLFHFKIFGGIYNFDTTVNNAELPVGAQFAFHVGSFDLGAVIERMGHNRNVTGAWFRGDAVVGLQGAYGFHFDDTMDEYYHEANLGADYSFLRGKLILTLIVFFNGQGALESDNYPAAGITSAGFPHAMFYVYGNITGVIDEFLNLQLDSFINCVDGSSYLIPMVEWTIYDGLYLTVQVPIVIGNGGEFPGVTGYSVHDGGFGTVIRVEGRF